MKPAAYSIIIPVYNGGKFLPELFHRLLTICKNYEKTEIIFVDDGSYDDSWKVIEKIKEENSDLVTGIKLSRNFGQHNATMCGFYHCTGDFIITIDDDLEMLPEDIPLLIEKQKENNADLTYGINDNFSHISLRGLLTATYKRASLLEGRYRGKGSGFRLLKKSLVENIKNNTGNFVFIDEFCMWYTSNIDYVNVQSSFSGKKKSSGYTLAKLSALTRKLIVISTVIPLRVITNLGLIVAVINLLLGMRIIIKKLFFNVPLGYTSIIVGILFSTGLIMFSIGILGEYLGIVVRSVTKMPPFNIDKKI
ncbi:MAG: glycosyltransferase [Bacteroidetes bacterium]|nr:glycosyltransferase [Bacteroidota bacterium]